MPKKSLRICKKGHQYYKSSDCPVCPICEKENKQEEGFYSLLSAPACRALENEGIRSLKQLTKFSEKEILALHGIGKHALAILNTALAAANLSFNKK